MAFTGYDYSSGLAALGQGIQSLNQGFAAREKRLEELRAAEAQARGFDQWATATAGGTPQSLSALGQGLPADPAATSTPRLPSMARGDAIGQYAQAIQGNESGGKYDIVGPTHPKYGRALGAYQVMESNLPSWSREALGREVTPEEFLRDPAAQDAIFRTKFGQAVEKYGNPQDAASVWFTGRPLAQGAHARDVLGTTGQKYVDMFNAGLRRAGGGTPATFAEAVPGSQSPAPVPQRTASLDYTPPIAMLPQAGGGDMVPVPPSRPDGGVQVASADPSFTPQMPTPRGGAVSPSEILVGQSQARQGAPLPAPQQMAQAAPMAAQGSAAAISDQQKQVIRGLLANPDTKAMGMALWQQALKPGEIKLHDLGDAVGVIDARGNLIRSIPKTRALMNVTADQGIFDPNTRQYLVQPQAKPHTTNVKPGEAVVDQNTGQVVYQAPAERGGMFDGKSVEGQALNHLVQTGRLTPEQAAQFGAGKTTTIDGKPFFMTPEGIFQGTPGGAATPVAPFPPSGTAAPAQAAPAPTSATPAAAPARPGMIQLGDGKPGNVPAEVGARIGLGNRFLDEDLPWVRDQIEKGALSGPAASVQMRANAGLPGQVMRRVQQGQEALLRNLTGAGMNESEAKAYADRYLPQWNDSLDTIKDKLRGLEGALTSTRAGAIAGKGVNDPALVGRSGQPQPSQPGQPKQAPAAPSRSAIEAEMIRRGLLQ